jgi:Domain of unknown function (DUF4145)
MTTRTSEQSIVWAHCNECGNQMRHELLHSEESRRIEEVNFDDGYIHTIEWLDIYEMLRCCGCEHICLRHRVWFSEASPGEEWEEQYYPPLVSRQKPYWVDELPRSEFLREILEEIYETLHANSRRLASMETRSSVEHIMVQKFGDHDSLAKLVIIFCSKRYITSTQKDLLATVLEFGHASVHRQFKPEPEDLRTTLDIVESLIADIYVHPDRARRLAERVPARKKLSSKKETD